MSPSYLESIFSLQGKTAILTGATGGLGSSLALALAKAGASIISIELPNDPNSKALAASIAEIGGSLRAFPCNLANKEALRACFKAIWDAGVVPDILVNAHGIQRRNTCEDATDDDLEQVCALVRLIFWDMQLIRLLGIASCYQYESSLRIMSGIRTQAPSPKPAREDYQPLLRHRIPGEQKHQHILGH